MVCGGGEFSMGASQFCSPHPKSLSQSGRGTLNSVPLLPFWEKGLGDEGKLAKLGCSRFLFSFFYFRSWPWFPSPRGEKEKNEERRMKTGCWHDLWGPTSFLFSFFYFRSWPWFPSPCGVRRAGKKGKKEERRMKTGC